MHRRPHLVLILLALLLAACQPAPGRPAPQAPATPRAAAPPETATTPQAAPAPQAAARPKAAPPPARHHFGLVVNPSNVDWEDPAKATALLKELGVKLTMNQLSWRTVEGSRGSFNPKGWADYDRLINNLVALGIEPTTYITVTPKWAIDPALSPQNWRGKKFGPPMKDPTQAVPFMHEVVRRYRDKVHYWAFYNAPQNRNHWTEPAKLAAIYQTFRQVLAQEQPQGKLIMSGLEGAQRQGLAYLDRFLAAGGGKYVDMYDFHQLLGGDHLSQVAANTAAYRQVMARHGEGGKLFQFGAIGVPSDFHPSPSLIRRMKRRGWQPLDYADITPQRQAAVLVAVMVEGRALGAERIYWTRTRDHHPLSDKQVANKPRWKLSWVRENSSKTHMGLVDLAWRPKPSFGAFKVLLQKLDTADVVGRVEVGPGAEGVLFRHGEKLTAVFYTWQGESRLKLKAKAATLQVSDIFGKAAAIKPAGGAYELNLTPSPIYVEGDLSGLEVAKAP